MRKILTINFERNDLGQVIDALHCRLEAYENTALYLDQLYTGDEVFLIEEVNSSNEAREIAANYRRIINDLKSQRAKER